MRLRYVVAASSAVLLALPASAIAAPPSSGAAKAPQDFGPPVKLTLITGDRLVVRQSADGRTSVTVDPASVRDGVTYTSTSAGKQVSLIPSDARPLLAAGRLDPRLFDITQLLKAHYDDAHATTLPLIAERAKRTTPTGIGAAQVHRRLSHSGYDLLGVAKKNTGTAWRSLLEGAGVRKLWLDGTARVLDDQSNAQIGAPTAWAAGYTGSGVTVAVLDTGYDTSHPDLSGLVTQSENFTTEASIQDGFGHGTHVASTIAGSGAASGGTYKGVAPGAKLAVGKVCNSYGGCVESDILAGMEWAATEVKAKVINMSLGVTDSPGADPLQDAVNRLSGSTSSLFVVAAGNNGQAASTLTSPGNADYALTVAAVDGTDQIASFSSRGPRLLDDAPKPDITAPGVGIIAARATGTSMGTPLNASYTAASGTSMATPHVAGAAAILAQEHPDWTGQEIKGALMSTAHRVSGQTVDQQGSGRLDLAAAIKPSVAPMLVGTGYYQAWPHASGQSGLWLLGYQNSGTSALEVTLTLSATDASGNAAPAGIFTLSRTQFTVPAGQLAGAGLSSHGDAAAPGRYFADITATVADGTVVGRTMTSTYIEPEMYNVSLTAIDRYGQAASGLTATLVSKTAATSKSFTINGATGTIRVPPGDYTAEMQFGDASQPYHFTVAALPVTVGSADVSLTADGRLGVPLGMTVDASDAAVQEAQIELITSSGVDSGYYYFGSGTALYAQVIPASQTGLTYLASTKWLKNGVEPSPYIYRVTDYRTGGIPAAPGVAATKAQMVHITDQYQMEGASGQLRPARQPWTPGQTLLFDIPLTLSEPLTRDEYLTPSTHVWWVGSCYLGTAADPFASSSFDGDLSVAGVTDVGTEPWFLAGIGPALPSLKNQVYGDYRAGDVLHVDGSSAFSDFGVQFSTGYNSPHYGKDWNATGTVTLASNGTTIGTGALDAYTWTLPAADQAYTLTLTGSRNVPYSTLSTQVSSVWTFHSAHDTAGRTDLRLIQPRLYLEGYVDGYNRAKVGSTTYVPYFVTGNASNSISPNALASGQIEVSYNDGTTWTALPTAVSSYGLPLLNAPAGVQNPSTPGYVSLRVTAVDTAGNTVTSTIIRAYQVVT